MNITDIKKCPNCKLINLYSAEICDCGYIFTSSDMDEQKSQIFDKMRRRDGIDDIIFGISGIIIGSILIAFLWDVSWVFRALGHGFAFVGLGLLISGIKLVIGKRK